MPTGPSPESGFEVRKPVPLWEKRFAAHTVPIALGAVASPRRRRDQPWGGPRRLHPQTAARHLALGLSVSSDAQGSTSGMRRTDLPTTFLDLEHSPKSLGDSRGPWRGFGCMSPWSNVPETP